MRIFVFLSLALLLLSTSSCKKESGYLQIKNVPETISGANTSSNINITKGLVAYYPFSGNANDASGNGNNGTVNGVNLTTDRKGKSKSAYYFDGYSEIIIPHNESLNITGDLTISGWFLSEGPPLFRTAHTIVCKRSEAEFSNLPYLLGINYQYSIPSDYKKPIFVSASYYPSGYQYIQSTTDVQNNSWAHLLCTISGTTLKMFLNGIEILSTTIDNSKRITNNASVLIGSGARSDKPAEQFVGKIDEIRIYNRALNINEIRALAK